MLDYHEIYQNYYPTPQGGRIKEKKPFFSIVNHANGIYTVNPRFNSLHLSSAFLGHLWYNTNKDLIPLKAIFNPNTPLDVKMYGLAGIALSLIPLGLLYYANKAMESVPEHESSHAYRMRYSNFMNNLKIRKTVMKDGEGIEKFERYGPEPNGFNEKYLSFVGRLEDIASGDSIEAGIARELAVLLSIPYLGLNWRKKNQSYIPGVDEELAKFDAVWASGIRVNDVSKQTEKKFRSLAFRTDIGKYVPLNSIERIEKKVNSSDLNEKDKEALLELQRLEIDDVNASPGLLFYLENPAVLIPKYTILKTLFD